VVEKSKLILISLKLNCRMNFAEFFLGLFVAISTEKSVDNRLTIESTLKNIESSTPNNIVETSKRTPYTIYVEGNVGCGKSTFLELFAGNDQIQIVQEPVAEWQNVSGYSLTKFYFHFYGFLIFYCYYFPHVLLNY
jgi:hypothetical protein